ncbi:LLM class flavin-dependent oxidoreductase [Citreicoccus inhibens]|uniref:LLM class flavin-dependent oxidoreductase n=1 Tax=Citreicoccus inhibens TaxID=2849499 RepID=UPI001F1EDF05|nr:LLM class flavin-dependent oxidoreductase [Citreicoccus inhibens]
MPLPRLSILDLIPVGTGSTGPRALRNSLDLARRADRLGFTRYWIAEHHNSRGLASSAPEIMITAIARETEHLRVGSGGIMLPNHSPLKVAETFLTLEALYPGRIDLGLGRAPGTDQLTALALRRSMEALTADDFPEQLSQLRAFAGEEAFSEPDHPFQRIRASPADITLPPIWLLGSSGFSARLAAEQGRGFAFAYHFSPEAAYSAMHTYRSQFRPSAHLERPYAILGVSVVCAETDERADLLAGTHDLLWVNFRNGRNGPIPSPEEARAYAYSPMERQQVGVARSILVCGSPARVRARLLELAEQMGADELMVTSHIHDHAERVRSYELLTGAFELPRPAEGTRASAE